MACRGRWATAGWPWRPARTRSRVSRTGFRPIDQPVTVLAGQNLPLRVALERTASVVTMITTPPGAEVFVNGVSKGRTDPAAASGAAAAVAAQLQVPVEQIAALVLTDLTTGTFDVEFRRDCYVTERRRISIGELGDLSVEPVTLKPSVGSLVLESEPAGAAVLIDGDARGEAPATIDGVCAGTHVVEFRSSVGRSVERISLEPGASLTVRGRVRPAFALLTADAGAAADPAPRRRARLQRGRDRRALCAACRRAEGSGRAKRRDGRVVRRRRPDAKPPTDLRDRAAAAGRGARRAGAGVGAARAAWRHRGPTRAADARQHRAGRDHRGPRSARQREAGPRSPADAAGAHPRIAGGDA